MDHRWSVRFERLVTTELTMLVLSAPLFPVPKPFDTPLFPNLPFSVPGLTWEL